MTDVEISRVVERVPPDIMQNPYGIVVIPPDQLPLLTVLPVSVTPDNARQ